MSKLLTNTFFIGLSMLVGLANAATVSVDVSGQVTSSSIPALPVGEPISGRITYDQSAVPDVGIIDLSVVMDLNGTLTLMLAGQTFQHINDPGAIFFPTVGFSDGFVTGMDFAINPFDAYGLTNLSLGTNPPAGGITTDQFFIRQAPIGTELAEGIFIFSAPALVVDIKPGSNPNGVNPRSNGVIPVAVLGSASFDAMQVDSSTVLFGPNEASPVHDGHVGNVNGDDFDDMVFHFKVRDTGIACGDTDATLTGETFGGDSITGTDAVKTPGCM